MKSKIKKVYKNICLNEWIDKEIKELSEKTNDNSNKINELFDYIKEIDRNSFELTFANIFHDTTKNSKWLNIPLSLSSGAIGYNFAYILYRTLNDIKPKNILELGLGQSTKIINEYALHFKNIKHDIVEHNKEWIEFFKKSTDMSKMSNIHLLECYQKDINGSKLNAYKGFKKEFDGQKYDLICIDGPVGYGCEYSRMDIIDILPNCLNKQFIILLDDCERIGEQRTIEKIEQKLNDAKIEFYSGYQYKGRTDVYICVSADLEFLRHI